MTKDIHTTDKKNKNRNTTQESADSGITAITDGPCAGGLYINVGQFFDYLCRPKKRKPLSSDGINKLIGKMWGIENPKPKYGEIWNQYGVSYGDITLLVFERRSEHKMFAHATISSVSLYAIRKDGRFYDLGEVYSSCAAGTNAREKLKIKNLELENGVVRFEADIVYRRFARIPRSNSFSWGYRYQKEKVKADIPIGKFEKLEDRL